MDRYIDRQKKQTDEIDGWNMKLLGCYRKHTRHPLSLGPVYLYFSVNGYM